MVPPSASQVRQGFEPRQLPPEPDLNLWLSPAPGSTFSVTLTSHP